jgi:hypothetical protein
MRHQQSGAREPIMESDAELEHIVALLRRRDRLLSLKIAAQIVCGVPLLAVGPTMLATIGWFATLSLAGLYIPWLWWFGALFIIIVPLLIGLEVRTAGRFLDSAVQGSEQAATLTSSLPGIYVAMGGVGWAPALANPRAFSAGLTEFFLCGPRLLVSAFRKWRLRRRLGRIDLYRAAELIVVLRSRDKGLEFSAIPRGGEQLSDLLPVLDWLAFHGWIGVGDKVPRVYLYSEARAALARPAARQAT